MKKKLLPLAAVCLSLSLLMAACSKDTLKPSSTDSKVAAKTTTSTSPAGNGSQGSGTHTCGNHSGANGGT